MSRYYNIPNKVNLPIAVPPADLEPALRCKAKASITIEHERRNAWPVKHRHPNISTAKENTPPRRAPAYHPKLYKPWQTLVKASVPKTGWFRTSLRSRTRQLSSLDPRLMFHFIDTNKDARLSYLEFRSWMLIIDQTLAEHELLGIFNEIDRNSKQDSVRYAASFSFWSRWWFYSVQRIPRLFWRWSVDCWCRSCRAEQSFQGNRSRSVRCDHSRTVVELFQSSFAADHGRRSACVSWHGLRCRQWEQYFLQRWIVTFRSAAEQDRLRSFRISQSDARVENLNQFCTFFSLSFFP